MHTIYFTSIKHSFAFFTIKQASWLICEFICISNFDSLLYHTPGSRFREFKDFMYSSGHCKLNNTLDLRNKEENNLNPMIYWKEFFPFKVKWIKRYRLTQEGVTDKHIDKRQVILYKSTLVTFLAHHLPINRRDRPTFIH